MLSPLWAVKRQEQPHQVHGRHAQCTSLAHCAKTDTRSEGAASRALPFHQPRKVSVQPTVPGSLAMDHVATKRLLCEVQSVSKAAETSKPTKQSQKRHIKQLPRQYLPLDALYPS